jgi:uncharacterized protein with HEPN domain
LDEISALEPQLAELCKKYGIAELAVIGSVARGMSGRIVMSICSMSAFPVTIWACPISRFKRTWSDFSAARLTWFRRTACTGPYATSSWETRGLCMQRDALYVADLVENTRTICDYLDGITREQWDENQVLRDAVLYRMLLLGESASALPDSLRDRYPEVAWRHIRAFRNLAVHKYFSIDWAIVWQIGQEEVPVLAGQARDILRAEFPGLAKSYEPGAVDDPEDDKGPSLEDPA